MSRINTGRVIVGGLACGVIMNLIDGVTNGVLLGQRWLAESNALNASLVKTAATMSTVGWIIVDFVLAFLIVWAYAAIRPRYGAGAGTALRAAILVAIASHATAMSYVFMGMYSAGLMCEVAVAGILGKLIGGYVGGMLYREEGSMSAAGRAAA
jgi:hypothetical protein